MNGLVEFLASCAYVYIHGTQKMVENCELFIGNVKDEIQLKDINDAYLFEPSHSHSPYKRH